MFLGVFSTFSYQNLLVNVSFQVPFFPEIGLFRFRLYITRLWFTTLYPLHFGVLSVNFNTNRGKMSLYLIPSLFVSIQSFSSPFISFDQY